jgi:hypothetical protein
MFTVYPTATQSDVDGQEIPVRKTWPSGRLRLFHDVPPSVVVMIVPEPTATQSVVDPHDTADTALTELLSMRALQTAPPSVVRAATAESELFLPTATQSAVDGHEIPARAETLPGTVSVVQASPPLTVIAADADPTVTQSEGDGQEIPSGISPLGSIRFFQVAPAFLVVIPIPSVLTRLSPTAAQSRVEPQEMLAR